MLDLDVVLYWTSLGLSAAGVVLFVWLMRQKRRGGRREAEGGPEPSEERKNGPGGEHAG